MTALADLILGCTALGADRFVLLGWACQSDDNGWAYASKTTVARWTGLSEPTVKRCTRRLVAAGWLVPTGERKQWGPNHWTPVYKINLPNILGISGDGGQIDPQGLRSSSFDSKAAANSFVPRQERSPAIYQKKRRDRTTKTKTETLSEVQAGGSPLPVREISGSKVGRPAAPPRQPRHCKQCGDQLDPAVDHLPACLALKKPEPEPILLPEPDIDIRPGSAVANDFDIESATCHVCGDTGLYCRCWQQRQKKGITKA